MFMIVALFLIGVALIIFGFAGIAWGKHGGLTGFMCVMFGVIVSMVPLIVIKP